MPYHSGVPHSHRIQWWTVWWKSSKGSRRTTNPPGNWKDIVYDEVITNIAAMTSFECRIERSSTWFSIPLNSEKSSVFYPAKMCKGKMDIFAYVRPPYLYMTAPQCMTRPEVKPDATMRSNSLASVRAAPVHVRIRRITTEKNLFIRSPIDCMKIKKSQKYI